MARRPVNHQVMMRRSNHANNRLWNLQITNNNISKTTTLRQHQIIVRMRTANKLYGWAMPQILPCGVQSFAHAKHFKPNTHTMTIVQHVIYRKSIDNSLSTYKLHL